MTLKELDDQFDHTKILLIDAIADHKCHTPDCTKCIFHNEELGCISAKARDYIMKIIGEKNDKRRS